MPAKRSIPLIEFKHLPITQGFGIQPIFIKPDGNVKCNLFNLYRKYLSRRVKNNKVIRTFSLEEATPKYIHHYKTEAEKQEIVKNAINYHYLAGSCVKKIFEVGRHIKYDITLDEFLSQGTKFITNRIFIEALNCFIYNKLVSGNKFISSNPDILNNIKNDFRVVGIFEKILVSENLLPNNCVIVAARGGMTFDNGILLCPLIYEKEFQKWLFEKNKSDDFSDMTFKNYPVMREYRHKMDLWGEFINDWIPLEWHFEVFEKNARNFYRIIHLKAS